MKNYNHRQSHARRANLLTISALFLCAGLRVEADGGDGGSSNITLTGGAGGTDTTGAPGGNGQNASAWDGSGGGGGGAGGGAGGQGGAGTNGGAGGAGGAGGTASSPNGQNAPAAPNDTVPGYGVGGGGGGGGGYNGNGAGAASIDNTISISGGNGGAGAAGGTGGIINPEGGGGGGGAGGMGLIVVGSTSNTNNGKVSGGNGGKGGTGAGGADFGSAGGNGGDGGVGILFDVAGVTLANSGTIRGGNGGAGGSAIPSGAGNGGDGGAGVLFNATGATLVNSGTIRGGNGGAGGNPDGNPGAAGAGISGGGLTITNSGIIKGGLDGAGNQGDAIQFTGGVNTLTLLSGSAITGNVVAFSGADSLILGGSKNATLAVSTDGKTAQYQDFGTYQKIGTSTWTLTNTTTAQTLWRISAGTLAISQDGSLGDSSSTLTLDGGTLETTAAFSSTRDINLAAGGGTIQTNANLTLSGIIYDAGSLTKTGSGALTLSGNNDYSGGTTLEAGTLVVANPDALGSSSVAQSGGILRTDNTNHVIPIQGNFDQTGGMLVLNLNGTPSDASNDQVHVNGTAALNGGLTIDYTAGALAPHQTESYTVITTTGGITSLNAAGYDTPVLQEGALRLTITGQEIDSGHDFQVTLQAIQTQFSALAGTHLTPNQYSVASYLDRFDTTIQTGPVIALLKGIDVVSVTPGQLGPYLDQLTPLNFESFASSNAFNNASFQTQGMDEYFANHRSADGTFVSSNGSIDSSGLTVDDPNVDTALQTVHSRLLAWNPAPSTGLLSDTADSVLGGVDMKDMTSMPPSEPANLWNVFVAGDVVLAQDFSDATAGLSHADAATEGMQLGADYQVTPNFITGVLFGYGHTDVTLDTLNSTASVDTYSPGVYASYSKGGWYANALGSYGFSDYDQDRKVAIGGFNGTAQSSPTGDQVIGNLDGGYDFHRGNWTYGPTLGVQYVHLDVDNYNESGLPGADLDVNENETDSLRSRLGGRVDYAFHDGRMIFTPHLSASWQHEFLDQGRGVTSQFDGIGAGTFSVRTANPSRDSALLDLGLDAQIDKRWTVFADYATQAGQENYFGQSIQAGVKIGF